VSSHSLVTSHKRPPQHVTEWDAPMQHPNGLEGRHCPQVGMRIEEHGILRTDDDVNLVDEVLTATSAHTVYRSYHWFPNFVVLRPQACPGVLVVPNIAISPPHAFFDIESRAEGSVTIGAEDCGVNVVVVPDPTPGLDDFAGHFLVEGVEHVGTPQGEGGDMILHLKAESLKRTVLVVHMTRKYSEVLHRTQ
jgi:hypothetical protein